MYSIVILRSMKRMNKCMLVSSVVAALCLGHLVRSSRKIAVVFIIKPCGHPFLFIVYFLLV